MLFKIVRRSPGPGGEIPHDASGNPVPVRLVEVFRSVSEFTALDNALLDIKRRMLDLAKICTPLKDEEHLIRRHIDHLQRILGVNRPERVHCDCGGDGCEQCGTRGYQTSGEIPR